MDFQLSFFNEFWIPEVDNGCRMWKCPGCLCRVVGQPLGWSQFNYYEFCPYCGLRLDTRESDLKKGEENEVCESYGS